MNRIITEDKEELDFSSKKAGLIYNTIETPNNIDNIFQTASSCSRLQYLNKTFADFQQADNKIATKPNHQKKSSNMLKYKKYIKPMMSFNKFEKRVTSPISISIKGKFGKNSKANHEVMTKSKKNISHRKTNNMHTNSIDYVASPSFHNYSVISSKKAKLNKHGNTRKINNMSILEKARVVHPTSSHQKKKTMMTGYGNLNYMASPRVPKKSYITASSRMEVINLNKDPSNKIKKVKNKKLFSTVIPNECISIK